MKSWAMSDVSAFWEFVLDESGRAELERARIASRERCRLALNQLKRRDHVLDGCEGHVYADYTLEVDCLRARVRVYVLPNSPAREAIERGL